MVELWGSALQVVHQTVFRPAELPGLIAERAGRLVGLLTYHANGGVLEVVTLNALERRTGVGTILMEAAAADARRINVGWVLVWVPVTPELSHFLTQTGFRFGYRADGVSVYRPAPH